ncbi:hypothetical protein MBM_07696 [Drepanopeziza brunnea f. sp. 'multigermtubi' MB_m1]|uniref:Uncharacterized protein n=1 Tax=Marssonina brunnea f. sp. multigermtubi (strain MB_m1) TaxID=1072389 RepID=K1XNF1_MARBU|nr:uncharacterized protein MBM_07696 [Drepanopeziza brunnea f. sp. 'multigermtubi' MB_m1]EKD14019.1 hypothetical protein MBM_07696 [Drepanopeziza brunnea f. sp. 'multigermtubi' MB_m1]
MPVHRPSTPATLTGGIRRIRRSLLAPSMIRRVNHAPTIPILTIPTCAPVVQQLLRVPTLPAPKNRARDLRHVTQPHLLHALGQTEPLARTGLLSAVAILTRPPPDGQVIQLLPREGEAVLEHEPEEPAYESDEDAEGEEEDDELEGGERVAVAVVGGLDGGIVVVVGYRIGVSEGGMMAVDSGAECSGSLDGIARPDSRLASTAICIFEEENVPKAKEGALQEEVISLITGILGFVTSLSYPYAGDVLNSGSDERRREMDRSQAASSKQGPSHLGNSQYQRGGASSIYNYVVVELEKVLREIA